MVYAWDGKVPDGFNLHHLKQVDNADLAMVTDLTHHSPITNKVLHPNSVSTVKHGRGWKHFKEGFFKYLEELMR